MKASRHGQLYWVINYLEKSPSLYSNALQYAAMYNQIEIGKYILENYDIEDVEIYMVRADEGDSVDFFKMLVPYLPDTEKEDVLLRILGNGPSTNITNWLVGYLDTNYPGWYQESNNAEILSTFIYFKMTSGYYDEAVEYLNRWLSPSGLQIALYGYYWGLSHDLSFEDFISEIQSLKEKMSPTDFALFLKTLFNWPPFLDEQAAIWILDTYHPDISYFDVASIASQTSMCDLLSYILGMNRLSINEFRELFAESIMFGVIECLPVILSNYQIDQEDFSRISHNLTAESVEIILKYYVPTVDDLNLDYSSDEIRERISKVVLQPNNLM
jgi:hypothetical protein